MAQIQELTAQLEQDKAVLATMATAEKNQLLASTAATSTAAPANSDNNGNSIENPTQFLENFQQLIQTAKGIIQKDPRQHNNNNNAVTKPPQETSPKFNQVC